jgi:hypothetical protein
MRRRALLATAAAATTATTAGCLGPVFGFGSGCARGADLRLRPTTDADTADAASDPLETLSPPERDAFDTAATTDGDGPTIWAVSEPFSDVDYVRSGEAYYAVETPVTSTADRPGYPLSLDTEGTADVTPDRRVAFDDLPDVDRAALFGALGFPSTRKMARFEKARAISAGGTLAYPDDDAMDRSELVPESPYEVLRIADRDFRFELGER